MSNKLKRLREVLIKSIEHSHQIFIVGHNTPDYDAIGASLGVATLAKELKRKSYIIVNDQPQELEPGVKKVMDDSKKEYHFINLEEFRKKSDRGSLLVVVDVNKRYLTSVQDDLDKVGKTIIIDHHQEDKFTIPAQYTYIDQQASSASEIVAQILHAKQIKYSKNIANYLLAGIILDTKRFQKNTTPTTLDTAEKLCRKGADYDAVNKLFISNFVEDDQIYSLIFGKNVVDIDEASSKEIIIANTHIQAYPQLFGEPTVSFTVNRVKPRTIYRQDGLAKTADKMLKYADMSFVLGYVSETDVGISARSKCEIDVGKLLGQLDIIDFPIGNIENQKLTKIIKSGGGNKQNAGGRITTNDIFSVEKFLMDSVLEMATPDEVIEHNEEIEKPVVLVRKRKEVKVH